MLPIRLGMVNADGPQELFVYALTRKGRVETTNYRTVKLPSDVDIPTYVKERLRALLQGDVRAARCRTREHARGVPRVRVGHGLVRPVRRRPAVDRRAAQARRVLAGRRATPTPIGGLSGRGRPRGPQNVFVTRLHVRYDGAHFPEDLVFQETGDRTNFQGRYVLRHAWTGGERARKPTPTAASWHPPGEGSPDPREPHRLGHQRNPAQTGPGAACRRRRPHLVGAHLAVAAPAS